MGVPNGHSDVSTMFLQNNGNKNKKWENGATSLFMLAPNDHGDICTVLLKSNSNASNERENNGKP